jgi:hypothetical protein
MNKLGITVALAIGLAGCAHKPPPLAPAAHHQVLRKVAPPPVAPNIISIAPAPVQTAPVSVAPAPKLTFRRRWLNRLVRQRAVKR